MKKAVHGETKKPRKVATNPLNNARATRTPISLPPDLDDPEIRGEVQLQVLKFTWKGPQPKLREVVIRVKWWGEQGHGFLIIPPQSGLNNAPSIPVCYQIRSSLDKLFQYFNADKNTRSVLGQALVNIRSLDSNHSVDGIFPVVTGQGKTIADIHTTLSIVPRAFESSFQLNEQLAATDSHLPLYPSPIQVRGKSSSIFAQEPFSTQKAISTSPIPVSPPVQVEPTALHSKPLQGKPQPPTQATDPVSELLQRGMRLREAMTKAAAVTSLSIPSSTDTLPEMPQLQRADVPQYQPVEAPQYQHAEMPQYQHDEKGKLVRNELKSRPNIKLNNTGQMHDTVDSLDISTSISLDLSSPSALALVDDPNGVRASMLSDFGEEEEVLLNEIFYGNNNKYNNATSHSDTEVPMPRISRADPERDSESESAGDSGEDTDDESSEEDEPPSKKQVKYSLSIPPVNTQFYIYIAQATGLTPRIFSVKQRGRLSTPLRNTYIVCKISKDAAYTFTTPVKWRSRHPVFGFQKILSFPLNTNTVERMKSSSIVLEVWDRVSLYPHSEDELIGIVTLPLQDCYNTFSSPSALRLTLAKTHPLFISRKGESHVIQNILAGVDDDTRIAGHLSLIACIGQPPQLYALRAHHAATQIQRTWHKYKVRLQAKKSNEKQKGTKNEAEEELNRQSSTPSRRKRAPIITTPPGHTFSPSSSVRGISEHTFRICIDRLVGLRVRGPYTNAYVRYTFPLPTNVGARTLTPFVPVTTSAARSQATQSGPQFSFNDSSTEHSFTLPSNIDMGETLESGINFHVFLKNSTAGGALDDKYVGAAALPYAVLAGIQPSRPYVHVMPVDTRGEQTDKIELFVEIEYHKSSSTALSDSSKFSVKRTVGQVGSKADLQLTVVRANLHSTSNGASPHHEVSTYVVYTLPFGSCEAQATPIQWQTSRPAWNHSHVVHLVLDQETMRVFHAGAALFEVWQKKESIRGDSARALSPADSNGFMGVAECTLDWLLSNGSASTRKWLEILDEMDTPVGTLLVEMALVITNYDAAESDNRTTTGVPELDQLHPENIQQRPTRDIFADVIDDDNDNEEEVDEVDWVVQNLRTYTRRAAPSKPAANSDEENPEHDRPVDRI